MFVDYCSRIAFKLFDNLNTQFSLKINCIYNQFIPKWIASKVMILHINIVFEYWITHIYPGRTPAYFIMSVFN